MAPLTRRNSALARKIATLELRLQPLVPLPAGPPHPAFPKSLMAFHLLTEDELDSIAHYYHQSTPGIYTRQYPANMNWDRDLLARPSSRVPTVPEVPQTLVSASKSSSCSGKIRRRSRQLSASETTWLQDLMSTVEAVQAPPDQRDEEIASSSSSSQNNLYANLSDKERIKIKRRKVGKFIGLVGMETPAEEIGGRIQWSLDRAVEKAREEMRRSDEAVTRRRKMA